MTNRRNISATIVAIVAALGLCACGSDAAKTTKSVADTTSTEAAAVTSSSESPETTDTPTAETGGSMDTTLATEDTTTTVTTTVAATTPPTDAPTTTIAPDALQGVPGIMPISLTAGGTDPGRPTFSWIAPVGAASYQLIVQAADGTPVWGWTGVETTVPLGGIERPADLEGPTLSGPSRVRVYALDAADALIAISGWVSVAGS